MRKKSLFFPFSACLTVATLLTSCDSPNTTYKENAALYDNTDQTEKPAITHTIRRGSEVKVMGRNVGRTDESKWAKIRASEVLYIREKDLLCDAKDKCIVKQNP